MDSLLSEKTAVVTGAASGLGRAIALRFAKSGSDVVVADIQEKPRSGGKPTHQKISDETKSSASFVNCDVTSLDDVRYAVGEAEQYGGIDIMVNNAGIVHLGGILEMSEDDYDTIMDINQKGVFFGCQAALPPMIEQQEGCIINMSSLAGIRGYAESTMYCMSKGAVTLLSYSLASEFGADGIRTNSIHPGVIDTDIRKDVEEDIGVTDGDRTDKIALERIGTPEDVAHTALFLASDMGSYINGHSLTVDGGMANIVV